ncbi:hypothetical protein CN554_13145 [Bacillus wiedmannii]|nr:hypothetical protein A6281_08635 [Bacillus wiedmannii]PEO97602.1 hypothetical protein CN554_13145 [Bacillus wiedmannii]
MVGKNILKEKMLFPNEAKCFVLQKIREFLGLILLPLFVTVWAFLFKNSVGFNACDTNFSCEMSCSTGRTLYYFPSNHSC